MNLTIHRDETDREIFHVYRYKSSICICYLFSVTKDLLFELIPSQKAHLMLDGMAYDDSATVEMKLQLIGDE